MSARSDQPPGLRSRKKARTRLAIQTAALGLFQERGYTTTTIEEIIDAAEVSESTFYRYFPTKADLVFSDDLDPRLVAAFRDQPPGLRPVAALRAAFAVVFAGMSAADRVELRSRLELILAVADLRAAMLGQFADGIALLADAVAERTGRRASDPVVRNLAGAVLGVGMTAMFTAAQDPAADLATLIDEALAQLEVGFDL